MTDIYLHKKDLFKGNIYTISEIIKGKSGNSYSIVNDDRIGAGGHAAVYKCINSISGEEFAVKFQLNFSPNAIKRFKNSIQVIKRLNHNNLLKYIDDGVIKISSRKKIYFLVMEYYQDGDLETKLCDEKMYFKPENYTAQFLNLASALAEFHKISIHRDIKPANILIGAQNWILADYGLCTSLQGSRITEANERVGPALWMTPEALNKALNIDDEISKASDVYQMASIFWFIVNHEHPSGVLTKNDWNGPEWLFQPIYKALNHNKHNRYKDGKSFYNALIRAQKNKRFN